MTESNGFLSREEFLKKAKRRYKAITLPSSGNRVRIQSLMESEKSRYETDTLAKDGQGLSRKKLLDARRRLIVLCLVDGNGNRMLTDDDIDLLKDLDGADTSAIYDEARVHCGFQEGDIEELVKNSEETSVGS